MTRPRVEPSPLARLRPSATTIGIAIAALVGVALVHRDPWSGGATKVPLVSNQSVARRLFPNLGEHDLSQARIELARAGGAHVRLVPGPDGRHQLYADEQLLGSADPVAVEGLWSSLRMATTLRAVDRRVKPGERRGAIVVVLGEETLTLEIMGPTAEGAGYYGALTHEHGDIWVVESEVVALVQQPPETWLSRRLLLVEPAATTRVAFEGDGAPEKSVVLARGEDGLWRGHREPDGRARLLATAAVETRL
ncbi:MAG: hypothetical protein R3A51_00025, partial [Nannocystaceae bacterium]